MAAQGRLVHPFLHPRREELDRPDAGEHPPGRADARPLGQKRIGQHAEAVLQPGGSPGGASARQGAGGAVPQARNRLEKPLPVPGVQKIAREILRGRALLHGDLLAGEKHLCEPLELVAAGVPVNKDRHAPLRSCRGCACVPARGCSRGRGRAAPGNPPAAPRAF